MRVRDIWPALAALFLLAFWIAWHALDALERTGCEIRMANCEELQ